MQKLIPEHPYKNKNSGTPWKQQNQKWPVRDSQTKHKPVISGEDTHFTPWNLRAQAVKWLKSLLQKVKSNSFADKHKNYCKKKT